MKNMLTLTMAAILATSALAAETAKPAKKPTAAEKQAQSAAAQQQVQQPAATGDSPLVAAAKRANRRGKTPTNVITNETLKKSANSPNAHVTTTTNQRPYFVPASEPSAEVTMRQQQAADKQTAAAEAAEKQKAAEVKLRKAEATAAAAEAGYFVEDLDPAQAERHADDASKETKPQEQKPPQE